MADQMDGKGRPPKRRSGLTRGQKGLIAAAAVLAVALAGVLAWQSLFVRPDLNTGKTEPQETEEPTDPVEEIDWGEGTRPRSDGERKSQDYYTVLILGRDTGGGGNTDTMLLASYDVTNQKATVMSIPRDTMVNVSWDIKKINSVYNTYGGGDRGIQALYKEISQLVGFEPDYQVIVEWEAVGEIVDAMGGVWFDVPRNMNYDDPLQNLHIHQEKGYRLLTGEDAMEVLRYRHDNRKNGVTLGYPEGDVGRIKTQQAFLKAMVEQLLKVENVPKVRQFIQVFQDNVETNLTFQNILWFAQAAFLGGLKAENVEFVTMPGNSSAYAYSASISKANGEYSEASYVTPYPNELLELVNTKLSPYAEVFTRSDLDMMTVNSDGSVSSSTGHVEDSNATHPRSYWQAQWTPQEPEEETPDYPVTIFVSREGYFKKITPQSLRMSGEQRFKEGDGLRFSCETTNAAELLVFSDRCQVYKARCADFDDGKASLLGDYLPTKLGFDEGESVAAVCLPGDYSGSMLFLFANGKAARVELSAYQTKSNRRKLTGAYSDRSELRGIFLLQEDVQLVLYSTEGRALILQTAQLAPKTTRTTLGVAVLTLRRKAELSRACPLAESGIVNESRYRTRTLPAAGALLREDDLEEKQMTLEL